MADLNYCSDYGSGGSSINNSPPTWPHLGTWPNQTNLRQTSASYDDLVMGRCTLEDIMKEFQMNGFDSPYTPDEDRIWANPASAGLSGLGPAGAYVRQKSWPAPDSSPAQPLPPPRRDFANTLDFAPQEFTSASTPIEVEVSDMSPQVPTVSQLQALHSLPDAAVFTLLQALEKHAQNEQKRPKRPNTECRFCKNNGERECYYRSHSLKDGAGRVACPVLRAFVCARCGARGDTAHTIKYCPLSTSDERLKSAAMLRSVRMASGRRRFSGVPPASLAAHSAGAGQYLVFGEPTPSTVTDSEAYNACAFSSPLDPLWAALEKKLLL